MPGPPPRLARHHLPQPSPLQTCLHQKHLQHPPLQEYPTNLPPIIHGGSSMNSGLRAPGDAGLLRMSTHDRGPEQPNAIKPTE